MGKQISVVATINDLDHLVSMSLYPDMKIVNYQFCEFQSVSQLYQESRSNGKKCGQCFIISSESRFPPSSDRLQIYHGESIEMSFTRIEVYCNDMYLFNTGRIYLPTSFFINESGEIIDLCYVEDPSKISTTHICPQMLRQYERIVRVIKKIGRRISYVYVLPEAVTMMERFNIHIGQTLEKADSAEAIQYIEDIDCFLHHR